MKSIANVTVLLLVLSACGERQLLEPPSGAVHPPVNGEQTQVLVSDAIAQGVIMDLRVRVLPTLSPGAGLSSLMDAVRGLAGSSRGIEAAAVRDRFHAVRLALDAYERGAPAEHRPDLDAISVAIEHLAERFMRSSSN